MLETIESTEGIEYQNTDNSPTLLIARNTIPIYRPSALFLDSESTNEEYNEPKPWSSSYCCVVINRTKHYFPTANLHKIKYFDEYLSIHKNTSNTHKTPIKIEIISTKYKFSMKELQTILDCKLYGEICSDYKFSRIPTLINALDFFDESIDRHIFYQYLLNYFPAINPSINAILISTHERYRKSVIELLKAMQMYQQTPNKVSMRVNEGAIANWKVLPLSTILKVDHLSYRILMRTLRLIKTQKRNQEFVLMIEFIHYRSWKDFRTVWKSVLNTRNYIYLLNILWTVINEYLRRKDLEYNIKQHDRNNMYKYKLLDDKHDIGNLAKQMIKRVAYRMFYDDQNLNGLNIYERFAKLVRKYIKISRMLGDKKETNDFYAKLVDKYFNVHHVYHGSIVILFYGSYFNRKKVKQRYLELNDVQKERFLRSLYETTLYQHDTRYLRICHFFKKQSWKYIVKTLFRKQSIRSPFIALVASYKKILDVRKDSNILEHLYQCLIEDMLFNCDLDAAKWSLILNVCENKVIAHKFKQLDVILQLEFLEYLFRSILPFNRHIEMKQRELMKYLLKDNKRIAIMLFKSWFNLLMIEEKDWIIDTFLNGSLSANELKDVLKTVSDTLLLANRYMSVPQEYFNFVNRFS